MNLDDLTAAMPEINSGDQISAALDFLLECDDLSDDAKSFLCNGYLMGLAVALDKLAKGNIIPDIPNEILERQQRWTEQGRI